MYALHAKKGTLVDSEDHGDIQKNAASPKISIIKQIFNAKIWI